MTTIIDAIDVYKRQPIVIVFLSLQKHFVSSLTAGGTKG